jgi:hypothetical protein
MDLAGLCREQQVQALSLNLFAVGKRAAPLGLMSGSGKLRRRVARFDQFLLRARSTSVTGGGKRTLQSYANGPKRPLTATLNAAAQYVKAVNDR